jgi:hypothetical protein
MIQKPMKMSKYTKVWILILGTMLSSVGIGKANALSLTYQGTTYQVQGVETTLSESQPGRPAMVHSR